MQTEIKQTSNLLFSFDIGTSSIGYCVFQLDKHDNPCELIHTGVRIFNDGREPQRKEPLSVARRVARGIRRNRDRNKNRIKRLVNELIEFGLLPSDKEKRDLVFQQCPYEARAKSVERNVSADVLSRAIIHIAKNRGFKSNRLSGDSEDSAFFDKINNLKELLGGKTLGQYQYEKQKKNQLFLSSGDNKSLDTIRFNGKKNNFFPSRDMLIEEFNEIKKRQESLLTQEQWEAIEETVFWQYPLRPVEKGKCRFFPMEYRACKELPISHEFRILQDINNLKYSSNNVQHSLNKRQRLALINLFNKQKSATFKSLLKLKDENKSPYFPPDALFNLDTPARGGKLFGNICLIELSKPEYLGHLATELPYDKLNRIVMHLIDPIIEKNGVMQTEEIEETAAWIKREVPDLSEEQVTRLCKKHFSRQTVSVSYKFLSLIVPFMREGMPYHDAVRQVEDENGVAFHHSVFNSDKKYDELPYYGEVLQDAVIGAYNAIDRSKKEEERDNNAYLYGKIANPTVHIALNQIRFVTNTLIHKFKQKPSIISVELARELKNSLKDKKQIEKQNKLNYEKNTAIKSKLKQEFGFDNPSRDDLVKVKLWEELGSNGVHTCVFTGRPIAFNQLFDGSVEVEHIVPFTRCYDDGFVNKTLAFKDANLDKGGRTPHEAFGQTSDYSFILQRALKAFGQSSKFERFKLDAYERFYGETGDFIQRQLNDTKYISKIAKRYFGCLVGANNVISVNGQLTSTLRKVWQLNHFKEKGTEAYRQDHRHHIVDAFVVGLTNRGLIKQVNTISSRDNRSVNSLFELLKKRSVLPSELRHQLFQKLETTIASHKPDHGLSGSLYNETAYSIHQGNDKYVLVTRKSIENLSVDELFEIRDTTIRQEIFDHLINYPTIENKKEFKVKFKSNLSKKLAEYTINSGHKKVRINVKNDTAITIQSAPFKAYALNNYAFVDIWYIPTKFNMKTQEWTYKYEGQFVPYAEADKYLQRSNDTKPHAAAKHIMRLFKNDSISLTDKQTGEITQMRVAGFSATNNKLDIRENLSADGKQNFKTIDVMFKGHVVNKIRGI